MAKPTRFTPELIKEYMKKGYWTEETPSDFYAENAKKYPDREALVDSAYRLTWLKVKTLSDRLALAFLDHDLQKDDLIVMQLPNCVESFLVRLACEKAGIICATPLMTLRQKEMGYSLKYLEAAGVVITWRYRNFDYFQMVEDIRPDLPALEHIFVTGDNVPPGTHSLQEMMQYPLEDKFPDEYLQNTKFKATEVEMIQFTSGTTGFPKFCEVPTCCRVVTGRDIRERLRITKDDIIVVLANTVAGLGATLCYFGAAPMAAAKVVMLRVWDAEEALRLIERENGTILAAIPAQLVMMNNQPDFDKYDLSSLRVIYAGTATLPYEVSVELEKKTGARVVQAIGSMDAGGYCYGHVDATPEVRLRTVGKPASGNEIKLVDANGKKVKEGKVGEIMLRGPHFSSGYYNDPAGTMEAWGSLGLEGWFATGDLGKFDGEGNLTIIGRKKEIIIRGGQNIYPGEIESLLRLHPRVAAVAVVPMPDSVMGEKACCYTVPKRGETFTFDEMIGFLKEKGIAPYKLPERLEIVDQLPLSTDAFKVLRRVLVEDITAKLKAEGKIGG